MRVLLVALLALGGCGSDCALYYGPGPSLCCGPGTVGYYRQIAYPGGDGTATAWTGYCAPPGTAPASDRPGVSFP